MSGALALEALVAALGGRLLRGDSARLLRRVMPLETAESDAICFVGKPKYLAQLSGTRAGLVLISPALYERGALEISPETAVLLVEQPYVAYAKAAQLLRPPEPAPTNIHPSAVIDPSAELGPGVAVGPFVWIGPRAQIGAKAVLHPGVHVEADGRVGEASVLYNHVVVRHGCVVGARCVVHPGAVIGSDGFGFAQESRGEEIHHLKIPQTGVVVVGDDVEIGANTCIDRAALGVTRIGAGTKIDNLVQIGHNAQIGPRCILVAQCGVAGSSTLGSEVTLGAQSGISGHLTIGERTLVYGQAGVIADLPPSSKVMGTPAQPYSEFFRNFVRISKLEALLQKIKRFERQLEGDPVR